MAGTGWMSERSASFRLLLLGDAALQIRLSESTVPDMAANRRSLAVVERLRSACLPITDFVPAYASVTLHLAAGASMQALLPQLSLLLTDDEGDCGALGRLIEVPVRYGGADGPDLVALAASLSLSPDELVARHVAPEYRVAMLGFRPGFPYLLGLDPGLAAPRLRTPRLRVPAGSVGIAGLQTGIYPDSAPGGWQLIGRTTVRLFDPARDPPTLLAPGDRLRFRIEAMGS